VLRRALVMYVFVYTHGATVGMYLSIPGAAVCPSSARHACGQDFASADSRVENGG